MKYNLEEQSYFEPIDTKWYLPWLWRISTAWRRQAIAWTNVDLLNMAQGLNGLRLNCNWKNCRGLSDLRQFSKGAFLSTFC